MISPSTPDYDPYTLQVARSGPERASENTLAARPLTLAVTRQVPPPAQAQLAVDAGEVGLDGLHADEQGGRDLGVAAAGCHEFGDPLFGLGKGIVRASG